MAEGGALPKNHPQVWCVTIKFQLSVIIIFPPPILPAVPDNSSVFKSSDPDCAITPPRATAGAVYLGALRTRRCDFS